MTDNGLQDLKIVRWLQALTTDSNLPSLKIAI